MGGVVASGARRAGSEALSERRERERERERNLLCLVNTGRFANASGPCVLDA